MNELLKRVQQKQGRKADGGVIKFDADKSKIVRFDVDNKVSGAGEPCNGVGWAIGVADEVVVTGLGGYSAVVNSLGPDGWWDGFEGAYSRWEAELTKLQDSMAGESCSALYKKLDAKAEALGRVELNRIQKAPKKI